MNARAESLNRRRCKKGHELTGNFTFLMLEATEEQVKLYGCPKRVEVCFVCLMQAYSEFAMEPVSQGDASV